MLNRLRDRLRRSDTLVLESFPLHTEDPFHASQAPAQVEAACKRGAHVIGLTETRGPTMEAAKRIADEHGYAWFQAKMDPHRNVSLLVKRGLDVTHVSDEVVHNNHRLGVTFRFHGSEVTVYQMHWEPTDNGHKVQTDALVEAMTATSKGSGLSFYMGDSNPHPRPQSNPASLPNKFLREAGMPVVWEELHQFPAGLGVNVIGHNLADRRVKTVSAELHPALGSDHRPATATFKVRRRHLSR